MTKEVKIFYDKAGEKYSTWQEEHYLNFSSLFDEVSWLQFSQYLPKSYNSKILDAGCGGGGWSLKLAKMGYSDLSLLDISTANIQGAKKIFNKHNVSNSASFFEGDLEKELPFPKNNFDFIFCERDPLQYCVEQQEAAFSNLVRILKPNSIITISLGTSYLIKQSLLVEKKYEALIDFEKHGVITSAEGPVKPVTKAIIESWFKKNKIKKIQIAGRLTISDKVSGKDWEEVYKDKELKNKILELEMNYQKDENLADYSSHIFAAGKKLS